MVVLQQEGDIKVGSDAPAKQFLVRRSKRLPFWLWMTIAHSLGIRIQPNDRAVLATILYITTLVSSAGFNSLSIINQNV